MAPRTRQRPIRRSPRERQRLPRATRAGSGRARPKRRERTEDGRMSTPPPIRLAIGAAVVAMAAGAAAAASPDPDYRGQAIGTIRSIDRAHQMVTLGDGLR